MSSNQPRGTPGLLLIIFAIAMLVIAVWNWAQRMPASSSTEDAPVSDTPASR